MRSLSLTMPFRQVSIIHFIASGVASNLTTRPNQDCDTCKKWHGARFTGPRDAVELASVKVASILRRFVMFDRNSLVQETVDGRREY